MLCPLQRKDAMPRMYSDALFGTTETVPQRCHLGAQPTWSFAHPVLYLFRCGSGCGKGFRRVDRFVLHK